jgi:uncharacterized membrane protein YjgN (DUF898 family)
MNSESAMADAPQQHDIAFTASGSEYFRIWIVNLLLIVVTIGIYLPWAKVRKLRYFHRNTWIDGDALDFQGDPRRMLRGTLIAGAFLIVYSLGNRFPGWATLVAALAFVGLWPALWRAAMRFRLANTVWRGLPFRFTGDIAGAYGCMLPPLALAMLPVASLGLLVPQVAEAGKAPAMPPTASLLVSLAMMAFALGVPYFLWRLRRYQHGNFAIGGLRTRFEADVGVMYGIFIQLAGIAMLGGVVALGAIFMGVMGLRRGGGFAWAMAGIVLVLAMNVLLRSYLQVRLQNLVWSKTGNDLLRFKSKLALAGYLGLQLKNYLLILLTLGLYWPFAVVATRRAQVEAVSLHTRIGLQHITLEAARENPGAVGEMAADLFGLDIGM